ncbi:hypothetical protein EAE96_010302 [Botrytis aclada]|nr:hypothetical protein EAE96_010302 [Botrytis aclada]
MLLPLSKSLMGTDIALPIVATTAVVLRIFARRMQKQPLLMDDYTIIVALLIALGICANGIYAASINIFGEPFVELTKERYELHGKVLYADVLLCHLAYGVIKSSVVLFYKRIFISPRFQLLGNILLGFDICWLITATFGHAFSAWPVSNWWISFTTDMDYEAFLISMAVFDLALDVVTLCLPVPAILRLQMNKKRKASLVAIFALGWFCIVASAIRVYYCWRLLLLWHGKIALANGTNIITYNDTWAHIEACISIVTACLPTLAPLVSRGFSMDSIFKSGPISRLMKSISSLTLRKSSSTKASGSSLESQNDKRPWQELNPTQVKASAVSVDSDDQIELVQSPNGIRVEQSFTQA